MRCERLQELLPAYLDGDLSGRLNHQVSDHLDGCERCRCELTAQQRALRTLDAGWYPVSIDLWADFSRRLQAQSPPRPSPWRFVLQPGLAIAAAAAAVALIVGSSGRSGPVLSFGRPTDAQVKIAQAPSQGDEKGSRQSLPVHSTSVKRFTPPAVGLPGLALASHASKSRLSGHRSPNWSPQAAKRQAGHHLFTRLASRDRVRPQRESVLVADLAVGSMSEAGRHERMTPGNHLVDRQIPQLPFTGVSPDPSSDGLRSRPEINAARAGDPLRVVVALASAEQDAASEQMSGELLRMAREVARVSGEEGTGESPESVPGGVAPDDGTFSARAKATGT